MRILVTGSSGLVGRELVLALRTAGHEVVEYDILHRDDIRDAARLDAAMGGCAGVFHLAAISRVVWGEDNPALCHDINVTGTKVVLTVASRQPSQPWVLFASSREVYGDPAVLPAREDAPMQPVNHYGRSKAAGEMLVHAACNAGLRCGIIRLSSVYGTENDHPDRVVPALLWRALAGDEVFISGADNFFDFVHVADCVPGLMTAATMLSDGARTIPTVHLATGVPTTLLNLAQSAIGVAGSASAVTIVDKRSFDVQGFVGDPERAREVLGWSAPTTLEAGLRQLRDDLTARGRPLAPVRMPGIDVAVPLHNPVADAVQGAMVEGVVKIDDGKP